MKSENILTIDYCIDTDTDIYSVGEIDHGIYVGVLESYFKNYGQQGKEDIIKELAFLIYEVESRWRDFQEKNNPPLQASSIKEE